MKRLQNGNDQMSSRVILLYILTALLLYAMVDRKLVHVKVLNYLRGSVNYVTQFSEGEAVFDKTKFLEALEYYQRLAGIAPKRGLTHGMLGYCYYHLGDDKTAIKFYKKAIEHNPGFLGFYFDLGFIHYKNKQWRQTVDVLKKATELNANQSLVYYGMVAEERFEEHKEVKEWIEGKSRRLAEGYNKSYTLILSAYDHLQQYDEMYNTALWLIRHNRGEEALTYYYAGKAAYHKGLYDQAVQHLNVSRKLNEDFTQAFYYLGLSLEKMGKDRLAKGYLQRTVDAQDIDKPLDMLNTDIGLYVYVPLYEVGI